MLGDMNLRAQAYLFYGIVRSFGWYWWNGGTDAETCMGISWLWALPATHPFQPAASAHDYWYEYHQFENDVKCSRKEADLAFLNRCLAIASEEKIRG